MKSGVIQQLADPTTIYNKPENLFVAGFIGSPSMNFLRGEIKARATVTVFRSTASISPSMPIRARGPLEAGRKVVLGVRPEHVKVDEPGAEMHDATVDIEEPMGADNLLWLKHAGHTMSVRINGSRRFSPGSAVKLGFDMSLASIFDAVNENRI
jgi:multiple sugar transport system ATP-binding protein